MQDVPSKGEGKTTTAPSTPTGVTGQKGFLFSASHRLITLRGGLACAGENCGLVRYNSW